MTANLRNDVSKILSTLSLDFFIIFEAFSFWKIIIFKDNDK